MSKKATEIDFRTLVDLSPIACLLTDPRRADNPIVAANAAFRALTGYRLADVIGRNCRFLSGPATEEEPREMLRSAVAAAIAVVVEITNYKQDGTPFRNAVMIAPIFDDAGAPLFFLGSQMAIAGGTLDDRREAARRRIAGLSRRQIEVLRRMARGLRHAQIASELAIAEKTVKMHRGALVARLGCKTSAEAIRIAIEARL